MEDTFHTIRKSVTGIYKEKGSRFISFAYPVENENQIAKLIDQLKKEYHDARHHCFAFIIGRHAEISGASDDGEPRHSAGDPILNQIRSMNITNILVVVVRYFGGTKLGKAGLIQAYKEAAGNALSKAVIVKKIVEETLRVYFNYPALNEVMKYISQKNLNLTDQSYDSDSCMIELKIRESEVPEVENQIRSLNIISEIERLPG